MPRSKLSDSTSFMSTRGTFDSTSRTEFTTSSTERGTPSLCHLGDDDCATVSRHCERVVPLGRIYTPMAELPLSLPTLPFFLSFFLVSRGSIFRASWVKSDPFQEISISFKDRGILPYCGEGFGQLAGVAYHLGVMRPCYLFVAFFELTLSKGPIRI